MKKLVVLLLAFVSVVAYAKKKDTNEGLPESLPMKPISDSAGEPNFAETDIGSAIDSRET